LRKVWNTIGHWILLRVHLLRENCLVLFLGLLLLLPLLELQLLKLLIYRWQSDRRLLLYILLSLWLAWLLLLKGTVANYFRLLHMIGLMSSHHGWWIKNRHFLVTIHEQTFGFKRVVCLRNSWKACWIRAKLDGTHLIILARSTSLALNWFVGIYLVLFQVRDHFWFHRDGLSMLRKKLFRRTKLSLLW
jgi:hypothetical protein